MRLNRSILKASAGTGKTYRMSWEYIAALLLHMDDVKYYEKILVMTFTKKATAEIQDRIFSHLKEMVMNSNEGKSIIELITWEYTDIIIDMDKLRIIYNDMLMNKNKLKIYTIDSFCNEIFTRAIMPVIGSYSYEIMDDKDNDAVIKNVLEQLLKENYEICKDFLGYDASKNLDNMISVLKSLIYNKWKMILLKKTEKKLPYKVGNYALILEEAKKEIIDFANTKDGDPNDFFSKFFKEYFTLSDRDERERYLIDNAKEVMDLKTKMYNGTKIRNKEIIENLQKDHEKFLTEFSKQVFNEQVIGYEEKLFAFIDKFYQVYDATKKTLKKYTFNDIGNFTFINLNDKENGFVTDTGMSDTFYDVIGTKIDTVFIDEFQDTSILQWQILSRIVFDTPNILCVGDEKQSIYSWRGGEKKLFEDLQDMIDDIKVDSLDVCFRSRKNIVEFTNEVFSKISTRYKNWKFEPVKYNNSKDGKDGYVEIIEFEQVSTRSSDPDLKEQGAKYIAQCIKEKYLDENNNIKGSIGIIARKNKDLDTIAGYLDEEKIPYILDTAADLAKNPYAESLYLLIKYLCKDDQLALLGFVKSYIAQFDNDVMNEIIYGYQDIKKYLSDTEGKTEDSKYDKYSILKILKEIKKIYKAAHGETSKCLYKIIDVFHGLPFPKNDPDVLNLYKMYDILTQYKYMDDFISEYEFDTDLDKFKKVSFGETGGLSLVTVHKSKGLGYDTVFYYHDPSNNRDLNSILSYVKLDKKFTQIEKYLYIKSEKRRILDYLPEYKTMKEEEEDRKKQEDLNVLYVVLTRAKNNLYIVNEATVRKENKENTEADMLYTVIKDMDMSKYNDHVPYDIKKTKEKNVSKINNSDMDIFSDDKNNFCISIENKMPDTLTEDDSKRINGIIIHYFMENIKYADTEEEIKNAKKAVFAKYGAQKSLSDTDKLLSDENISKILEICRTDRLFEKWDNIFNEYVIYDKDEKENRIDRLMVRFPKNNTNGEIYIVDYKTGGHEEDQMERYKKLIVDALGEKISKYNITTKFVELYL